MSAIAAERFRPPPPDGVDTRTLRSLVQQGRVVEAEGFYFHPSAVERAGELISELLANEATGVTASQIREGLGTSRKWALPLLGYLDANGFTRRRGDLRIAGPRLGGLSER